MRIELHTNERDQERFNIREWAAHFAAAEEVWVDGLCIKTHQARRPTVSLAMRPPEPAEPQRHEALRDLDATPGMSAAEYAGMSSVDAALRGLARDAAMVGMPPGGQPGTDVDPDVGEALRVSMQQVWWGALERWALERWGADNIKNVNDLVICGPLGRRHDYLTFWPAGGRVRTGCFEGTLDEFKAAVLKSYNDEISLTENAMNALGTTTELAEKMRIDVLQLVAWRSQYLVTVDGWRQWQKNPRGQA